MSRARDGAHLGQGALPLGAGGGRGVALDGGGRQRLGDRRARPSPRPQTTIPAIRAPRSRAARAAAARARAWRSDDAWRRSDSARPAIARARSSAVRSASRASTSAARAPSQRVRGGVADLGVRLVVDRLVLGDRELLLGGLQREQRVGPLRLDRVAPRPQPLGLGAGRPHGLLQPAQLGRGGARPALGGRAGLPGGGQVGQPRRLLGPRALQRGTEPGQLLLDAVAGGHRLVHRGLHVQRARRRRRIRRRPVRARAGRPHGDGREPGGGDRARGVQVVDDHDAVTATRRSDRGQRAGARTSVGRPTARRPRRRAAPPAGPVRRLPACPPTQQRRPPRVRRQRQLPQRPDGGLRRVDRHRVRQLAQRRRDGGARVRLDRDQPATAPPGRRPERRRRAARPTRRAAPARPTAPPPAPASAPAAARRPARPPPARAPGPAPPRAPAPPPRPARPRPSSASASTPVASRAASSSLVRPRACARPPRPAPRTAARSPRRSPTTPLRSASARPASVASPARRSASARTAARWARSAAASVASCSARSSSTSASCCRASTTASTSSASCSATISASASSSSGSRPGVRASPASARCRARSCASPTVPRRRSASVESRYQVSCAAASRGASWARASSSRCCSARATASCSSTSSRRARATASSASSRASSPRRVDEVVRGQPQTRVAQLGLHRLGPPGDLRLPAQRLELAAQLAREVRQPREVGLHRVELPQRLLLALAVLEDACGLLDVGATVFRARLQHGVELALPDDDVQLATDPRVAEQLLDVEQAARRAVDLVLARAVAEHPAGDRDLGVVDRQRAVGVVDRQRDLGAAQRRAARGAGEDDVLHLPAAQRLRALLAEHPADRVDDVALARAVRADDAGDPRLQAQGGGRGEGLEALQREALQMHASLPRPADSP